jgi:hypothetical protein
MKAGGDFVTILEGGVANGWFKGATSCSEAPMDAFDLLLRFVGEQLIRVRRIFFTHAGVAEQGAGPLELSFGTGTVLLDVGADGETLTLRDQPWTDPFEPGPLSPENQAWIAEHGKWKAFDVSGKPSYDVFVGKALTSVKPLRVAGGNVCGVRLGFESLVVDFVGSADEALVFFADQNDLSLAARKVFVGEEVARLR